MNKLEKIILSGTVFGVALGTTAFIYMTVHDFMDEGSPRTISDILSSESSRYPDKLGWMDDAPLTDADRQRIAQIGGTGYPGGTIGKEGSDGHIRVIRDLQSGVRGQITRRDFELLRQDRRRARAAYPDVPQDKLFRGVWLSVSKDARIPMEWNTSLNGDATLGPDGKWYMDGGVYESVTNPEYQNRASAAETKKFSDDLRAKERFDKLARTNIRWSLSGSMGEVLHVECSGKQCVIAYCEPGSSKEKRYTFPFIVAEWVNDPGSMKEIEHLPSFKDATVEEIDAASSGPANAAIHDTINNVGTTVHNSDTVPYYPGMMLMPGQSAVTTVTIPLNPSAATK